MLDKIKKPPYLFNEFEDDWSGHFYWPKYLKIMDAGKNDEI